ncbi:hypothetical protein BG000_006870 [Podila horticola]|nr:hypothetical protein BG000_006870 [Podila horticola]
MRALHHSKKGPFYAFKIVPGDIGTKGGIVTDEHARALRADGSVIQGIWAAGNASAAVMEIVRSAWKIISQFPSRSIKRTIKFYSEELKFELGGFHPDDGTSEPTFCSVFIGKKAEANIYFDACAPDDFHPAKAMIALGTTQLDELYTCLQSRTTVDIVEPIQDEPWGFRQFTIKDNDGNHLTFFKFLEGGNPGTE